MPAELPPASSYTYAVSLSVDQAVASNAKTVQFNKPVFQYVENFLNFPVGGIVPVGYYDRDQALWIPSDNGRVVQIIDRVQSFAVLDVDGNGSSATSQELADLQITPDEL